MATVDSLVRRFTTVFEPQQAQELAEAIHDAYNDLVKTSDFNELKAIVRDLAESQNRTAVRLEALTAAQERTDEQLKSLTVAQDRTDEQLKSLTAAQERTEARLEDLTVAQERLTAAQERTETSINKLTREVRGLSQEMGGLSRSFSYSLENEAYRWLPRFLDEQHGIRLTERLIRTEINGEEINFFGHGRRNSHTICLVGEMKLRLDERRNSRRAAQLIMDQLDQKANAVQQAHPDCEIVRLLVTHNARPSVLELARERHVLVVQSFEW
jgi:predicted nuclease with TOPRIM domain